MPLFKYDPLDLSKTSVRLLKIERHPGQAHLCCSLTEITLEEAHSRYIAVSHVWGNDYRTARIVLNGADYLVTPQVWHLLALARQRNITEYLWIDAVCIDQSSQREKAKQIPLMGKIYAHATSLISWLWGPLDGSPSHQAAAAAVTNEALQRPPDTIEKRQALVRLVFHRYWSRLWIVQEIHLSHKRQFWWEGQCLSSDRLCQMIGGLRRGRMSANASMTALEVWRSLCETGEELPEPSRPTLLEHLSWNASESIWQFKDGDPSKDLVASIVQYGNFQCSLNADHVLGLLGMVVNGDAFITDQTMTHADLLSQIYGFNDINVSYDNFAKAARFLGGLDGGGILLQRMDKDWCEELSPVLEAIEHLDPLLKERLEKLRRSRNDSISSNKNAIQRLQRHGRAARRILEAYAMSRQTARADTVSGVLKAIGDLIRTQNLLPVLKLPLLGMYYCLERCSGSGSKDQAKITKIVKVSHAGPDDQASKLTFHICHIDNPAKERYIPKVGIQMSMLSMLGAGVSVLSTLQPTAMDGRKAPRASQIYVSWSLLDLFKVLELSKDSHPIWRDGRSWTIPQAAPSAASVSNEGPGSPVAHA